MKKPKIVEKFQNNFTEFYLLYCVCNVTILLFHVIGRSFIVFKQEIPYEMLIRFFCNKFKKIMSNSIFFLQKMRLLGYLELTWTWSEA